MGWFIEALANVFLELLGDLMAWTTNLVVGLSLDIGMETAVTADGRYIPKVPDIGTLINPIGIHGYLLERTFPQAASFTTLFMILGMSIIAFLFLVKMAVAFGGPFVKSESGGTILARTCLAIFGTAYSYTIFVMFESLFNGIYAKFMEKYISITSSSKSYALDLGAPDGTRQEQAVEQYSSGGKAAKDAFKMLNKDLIEGYEGGMGLALSLITIVLFSILLISFMRLVLEIYERYVMIGVLFYTAPLAFSTLVSKENNIFTSWVQMVISEFVVMCSNLFFTGVFISAWQSKLTTADHALFPDSRSFITYMFLLISWLIIGQQFDQHLKGLGLSTAQTGRGLGGAVTAGLGTAAFTVSTAANALRSGGRHAYDAALGNTKFQQAAGTSGPVQDFFRAKSGFAGLSKPEADKALSNIQSGNSRAFNNMASESDKGAALMNLASASMGKTFDKTINEQTGKGAGSIDLSSVKMDSNGLITGKTFDNDSFALQSPGGSNSYVSKDLGSGWSTPLTEDQYKSHASLEAGKMPTRYDGNNVSWKVDTKHDTQNPMLIAYGEDQREAARMPVKDIISGDVFYDPNRK